MPMARISRPPPREPSRLPGLFADWRCLAPHPSRSGSPPATSGVSASPSQKWAPVLGSRCGSASCRISKSGPVFGWRCDNASCRRSKLPPHVVRLAVIQSQIQAVPHPEYPAAFKTSCQSQKWRCGIGNSGGERPGFAAAATKGQRCPTRFPTRFPRAIAS